MKKFAKFMSSRKESLLHKEVVDSLPYKDQGVFTIVSKYIPISYQGKLKKELLKKTRDDFQSKTNRLKEKINLIWKEEVEIIIIYKLGNKYSIVDIDNLNKYMIDSMKGIFFEDDKQVKLLVGRKDKLNETYLQGKHVEKAIIRIELFNKSKVNRTLKKIFSN